MPGREAIFEVAKGKSPKRPWVVDADLAGAVDRIAHDHRHQARLSRMPGNWHVRF